MAILTFQQYLDNEIHCGTSKEHFNYAMVTYPDKIEKIWREYCNYLKENQEEVKESWMKSIDNAIGLNKYMIRESLKVDINE